MSFPVMQRKLRCFGVNLRIVNLTNSFLLCILKEKQEVTLYG